MSTSLQAVCIGQAKSGTASLTSLLSRHFRAAHEPERARTLDVILRHSAGEMSDRDLHEHLIERERRLGLQFDIAWANQFLVRQWLDIFPEAKFIALVRHPRPWLESLIGHLLSREIPGDVRQFLDWWFKPEQYPFSHQDKELARHGVYPIAAFLNAWRRHVAIAEAIPEARLLILTTSDLTTGREKLADFLDIPVGKLNTEQVHINQSTWTGQLNQYVDPGFIDHQIQEICGAFVTRYFDPYLA